jgi:hypothetical protein
MLPAGTDVEVTKTAANVEIYGVRAKSAGSSPGDTEFRITSATLPLVVAAVAANNAAATQGMKVGDRVLDLGVPCGAGTIAQIRSARQDR